MLPVVLYFIAILAVVSIIIPINTFCHEAGHAIAAAQLTKGRISVFLGSHGNTERSRHWTAGRYDFWLSRNLLRWRGGLCMYNPEGVSLRGQIVIVLAGPLATLLLLLILLTIIIFLSPVGVAGAILYLCAGYCGLSFLTNLIPQRGPVNAGSSLFLYSDGTRLAGLMARRRSTAYVAALAHFEAGAYTVALAELEVVIASGKRNEEAYRMAVTCCIKLKQHARANDIQIAQMRRFGLLNHFDQITRSLVIINMGDFEKAIRYLKHILESQRPEKYTLNNLGYVLGLSGQYDAAIPYLDKAIALDSQFSYPYSNRAYALLQCGRLEDGIADTEKAAGLPPDSGGHPDRNRGIYQLRKGNYKAALALFEAACEKEPDIPGLAGLIAEARKGQALM